MSPKPPLQIRLRSGETLEAQSLGISGYVANPIGGLVLGGTASREHVGKFCIGVLYTDGDTGLIAQEEISEIRDAKGKLVPYGNSKYPGHPDFDPREGFDPIKHQMEIFQRSFAAKEQRQKHIKEKGLSSVIEEEIRKMNREFAERSKEQSEHSSKKNKASKKSKSPKTGKKAQKSKTTKKRATSKKSKKSKK